jgi:hypothetical protein
MWKFHVVLVREYIGTRYLFLLRKNKEVLIGIANVKIRASNSTNIARAVGTLRTIETMRRRQ